MHYNELKGEKSNLTIVVYKHSVLSKKFKPIKLKFKPDGTLSKTSVVYDISSIQRCSLAPPRQVKSLLEDPYSALNAKMSDLPFEEWYEVELFVKAKDHKNDIAHNILNITNVSNHKNKKKRIH